MSVFTVMHVHILAIYSTSQLFLQFFLFYRHLHMSIIHLLPEVSLRIISMAPSHDLINIPNNLRQTPLHLAVATRQLIIVRRLMAAGAALDFPDHCGNTALHIACREGMLEMVQLLLRSVHYDETLMNAYEIPYQRIPQDLSLRNYDGKLVLPENL